MEEREEQAKKPIEGITVTNKISQREGAACLSDAGAGISDKTDTDSEVKRAQSVRTSMKSMSKSKSAYADNKKPVSWFEREALMLGVADENLEYRHVNQLLIRGENVVLVSIIDGY